MTKQQLIDKILPLCEGDSGKEHIRAYLEDWLDEFAADQRERVLSQIPETLNAIQNEKAQKEKGQN